MDESERPIRDERMKVIAERGGRIVFGHVAIGSLSHKREQRRIGSSGGRRASRTGLVGAGDDGTWRGSRQDVGIRSFGRVVEAVCI